MTDSGEGDSATRRNSSGKRFVRRARRWAELQQKRQGRRNCETVESPLVQSDIHFTHHHNHYSYHHNTHSSQNRSGVKEHKYRPPEPPNVYDYVEMAALGSGVMVVDEEHNYELLTHEESRHKQHLAHTRSFPITILRSKRQQVQVPAGYYGYNNHQTCQRSTSDAHFYSHYSSPPYQKWFESSSPAQLFESTENALSLITNDLSMTSISSEPSTTSPSSISNNSEEDISSITGQHFKFTSSSVPKSFHSNPSLSMPMYISSDFAVNTHPPPERNWVMIRHADPERPIATFTVLCYNVLCDKYATVNQYSYCPSWALNWEYRKNLIIKEIRTYEADIITLQEVETEQYRTLFLPELKTLGYTGIFAAKSRAKTMTEEERKYVDGCAIFWKVDKFDMDKQHLVEFGQVATNKGASENMINRVMPRDNIALTAVLKIKENVYANRRMSIPPNDNVVGNPLVVCTAHIHWDPEFCDVKLVQSMMMAHEVAGLLGDVSKRYNITQQQVPILICGDLNSLPDSGVFEYLSRGQISRRHLDLKKFADDPSMERFACPTDKSLLAHPLRVDSACDTSAIPFTNYTLDFKGMIDYIFATPQSLARLGILGPFDPSWVTSNKILVSWFRPHNQDKNNIFEKQILIPVIKSGFPHPHVPSDHIPIMAQYAIIPTTHQRQPPPPQAAGHAPAGVIGSGYPAPAQNSFLR
uniref:poly(A)-specific ribonuclease n=1 Tax=Caenorhabditis japonica TaxID=281687 RepID=A0A8R1DX84_CAEJA